MAQLNEYQVIVKPITTEKNNLMMQQGKYMFQVDVRANKLQIAEAVSLVFNVDVEKVNVMNNIPKMGRWGRKTVRRQPATKKAIVTLAKGQRIESLGI